MWHQQTFGQLLQAAKWGMRHATGHAWESSMCMSGQPERPVATHIFSSQPACSIMLSSCRQQKRGPAQSKLNQHFGWQATFTLISTMLSLARRIQSVSPLVSCLYCKP